MPRERAGHGAGCGSSGGSNTLAAATGPPSLALVVTTLGMTPTGGVPLASLPLPQPQPGCLLHVLPDFLGLDVTTNGSTQFYWPLPNDPVFAGVVVHLQMVVLEIHPAVNVLATTGTNSLLLVVGTY